MIAPVELVRELLFYRDMRMVRGRDWGLITAFLAGSSLALPILAPFAIGSIVAFGIHKLRGSAKRRAIAGVAIPPVAIATSSTTIYGTARKFRTTVPSLVDAAPVLIEHAMLKNRHDDVILRRMTSAPFFLDTLDGGPVLVSGVTRVSSPTFLAHRTHVKPGDPRLHEMGVPDDLAVTGELEIAQISDGGLVLAVTGRLEDEPVPELAFHRDGGTMQVMRGRAGAPVIVEDRRMIGALLTR